MKDKMTTKITVISFEAAAKVVGRDMLMQLIRRGIVRRARLSNQFSLTCIESDSLPRRFRQASEGMIQNPSLSSSRA